jgi:dTDP-4-dehydrorhamnose 3,5-epimerase
VSSTTTLTPADVIGLDRAEAIPTAPPEDIRRDETIADAHVFRLRTRMDEHGTECDIYDERWDDGSGDPVPFVYRVTVRPGQQRGWVVHREQDDRLFFASGAAKLSLWDGREDSPTYRRLEVQVFGTDDRAVVRIPAGVYHAVKNVSDSELVFVNMPTRPYDHMDPDKYRLPLENPVIPYIP